MSSKKSNNLDDSNSNSNSGTIKLDELSRNSDTESDASFSFSLAEKSSCISNYSNSNSSASSVSICSSVESASSLESKKSRSRRKSKKRSIWWNHFTLVDKVDQKSTCNLCNELISSSGNTKNFASHFQVHHQSDYQEITG